MCSASCAKNSVCAPLTPVLGVSTALPYLAIPAGSLLTIIEMGALMIRDPDPPPQDIENEAAMAVRS